MTRLARLRPLPGSRRLWVALLVLASLAGVSRPAAAQRSVAVRLFSTELDVRPDGAVRVTETIRYAFEGSWNGVFREIPVRYRTPYGFDHRMYVDDVEITDGAGRELWYEDSRHRHYRRFKIRVPGASDAERTVRIAYTARRALLHFEEHDELYWNVTGDESELYVAEAEATVRLPEGATGLRASAFIGGYGSTEDAATVTETEDGFYFRTEGLGFREGLTVVVGWDPGVVARPTLLGRAILFLRANWPLALPFLSFLVMWAVWSRRGRDPARRPVSPRYEPPEGMTPSEGGTLIDGHPGLRDIIADLVQLAVDGWIRIEELEGEGLGSMFGVKDYRLELKRSSAEWDSLPEHQRELLEGVFGAVARPGKTEKVSDLSGEFYTQLPPIREGIYRRLLKAGHYSRRPDHVQYAWLGVGAGLVPLLLLVLILGGPRLGVSPTTAVIAAIGVALPVLVFGLWMPARTIRGTRQLERILGFQEFLERVESDRFKRMITGPEMFERFLPWAMALGVEERWARAFDDLGAAPPSWYDSRQGGFRPSLFVSSLNDMGTRTGAAMQSAPRSTGSSGFSSGGGGGGFSGGGMGGGSTGGW